MRTASTRALLNAIYFRNLEALQDVAPTAANEKLIRGYIGSLDKHPAGFADRHGLLVRTVLLLLRRDLRLHLAG